MSTKKKIIIVLVILAICFVGYKLTKQMSKEIDTIDINPETNDVEAYSEEVEQALIDRFAKRKATTP